MQSFTWNLPWFYSEAHSNVCLKVSFYCKTSVIVPSEFLSWNSRKWCSFLALIERIYVHRNSKLAKYSLKVVVVHRDEVTFLARGWPHGERLKNESFPKWGKIGAETVIYFIRKDLPQFDFFWQNYCMPTPKATTSPYFMI